MKTAVIYNSQTGFTKRYAEWISEGQWGQIALTSELLKSKTLIYMMPLFLEAGCAQAACSKISWFRSKIGQWPGKTVIAFCTGGSPAESPEIEAFLKRNFSGDESEKGSGVLLPRRVLL